MRLSTRGTLPVPRPLAAAPSEPQVTGPAADATGVSHPVGPPPPRPGLGTARHARGPTAGLARAAGPPTSRPTAPSVAGPVGTGGDHRRRRPSWSPSSSPWWRCSRGTSRRSAPGTTSGQATSPPASRPVASIPPPASLPPSTSVPGSPSGWPVDLSEAELEAALLTEEDLAMTENLGQPPDTTDTVPVEDFEADVACQEKLRRYDAIGFRPALRRRSAPGSASGDRRAGRTEAARSSTRSMTGCR